MLTRVVKVKGVKFLIVTLGPKISSEYNSSYLLYSPWFPIGGGTTPLRGVWKCIEVIEVLEFSQ